MDETLNLPQFVAELASTICLNVYEIDNLLKNHLNKISIQATDDNAGLSSSNCVMYLDDKMSYQSFGRPDAGFTPANQIMSGSRTNRCQWNFNFKLNSSDISVKGFFHGNRENY